MTTPDDMERARRLKWKEEGFDHEAEVPLGWGALALLGGLLVVILPLAVLLWPVSALQGWIAKHSRHGGRWIKWRR